MFSKSLTITSFLGLSFFALPSCSFPFSSWLTHQQVRDANEARNVTIPHNVTGAPPLSPGAPTGYPPLLGIRKMECPAIEFKQSARSNPDGLMFTFENLNSDVTLNWVDIHYQFVSNVTGGNVTGIGELRPEQINRRMTLRGQFGKTDSNVSPTGRNQVFEYATTPLEVGQSVRYSFTYSNEVECNTGEFTYTVPPPPTIPPPQQRPPSPPTPQPVRVERIYLQQPQQPIQQKKPTQMMSMPPTHRWRMVMFEDSDIPTAGIKTAKQAPQPIQPPTRVQVPFRYVQFPQVQQAPVTGQNQLQSPLAHYRLIRIPSQFGISPREGIQQPTPTTRYRLIRLPLNQIGSFGQIQPVQASQSSYPQYSIQPSAQSQSFQTFGDLSNLEEEEFEISAVDRDINQILSSNDADEWYLSADSSDLLKLSTHSVARNDFDFETNQEPSPFTPSPDCPLIQFKQRVVPSNETLSGAQFGMGPTVEFTNLSTNRTLSFILMVFNATTPTQPQLTMRGRQLFVTAFHPFYRRVQTFRGVSADQRNVTQNSFTFILPPLPANSQLNYYFVYASDSQQCITNTFTHTITADEAGRVGRRLAMRLRLLKQKLDSLQKMRQQESEKESEDEENVN